MQNTENTVSKNPDDTQKEKIRHMVSKHSEEKHVAEKYQLANLSLRIAKRLENSMETLSKNEDIKSVKAACMCASELNKIMRLNLEFYKEGP